MNVVHWFLLPLACGILLLRWTPSVPSIGLITAGLLCCASLLLLCRRGLRWLLLLSIGWLWACLQASLALQDRLDPALDGQTRWIEGRISGLPQRIERGWRFELEEVGARRSSLPSRLRISWFDGPELQAGERWRLAVTLRRPRGLSNTQGFDYEAWLLARGIGATGTVKAGSLLEPPGHHGWRDGVRQRFLQSYAGPAAAALSALVLGDGSSLTREQWQLLQVSGTVHLLVISGQHIVLVAGLLFAAVALAYRRGVWPVHWPWLPLACGLALFGALLYGALAGMGVPVQRACVMLAVLLLWRLLARHASAWQGLLLALTLVLLADPLVSLQPGFWLSFAAVALLIWCLGARLGSLPLWRQLLWVQWAMTLGLAPLLLALGLPVSPGGLLVNLLVVPWVGLLIVPLALAGFLLLPVPLLGTALLWLAGWQLHGLFLLLEWLADSLPLLQLPPPSALALLLALAGVLLHLQPAGAPWRLPALLLLLPLLWPAVDRPEPGQARVRLLDVGQGLAVLVQTARHDLLYDAGPRTPGFDAGEMVVLPLLRAEGISRLDLLLLSHADQDHAGGARALLSGLPVGSVLAGEVGRQRLGRAVQSCRNAQRWQWDGVQFTTLLWAAGQDSNDQSCVLLVEARGERILLTGDISQQAEAGLIASGVALRADWLLAPHHGSRSSSSQAFIAAVRPHSVLISRGRHNAYRHPHPLVLSRYRSAGVLIYDTAHDGALQLQLGARGPLQGARRTQARFWREN